MKEEIYKQIGKELKLGTWVDFLIMVIAVSVTLIFFGVAGASAAATVTSTPNLSALGGGLFGGMSGSAPEFSVTATIIMFVTLIVIAVINWYAVSLIRKNRVQRAKLNEGLVKLLKDETVDQYNDGAIYKTYEARYTLFAVILSSVAALSIIIPIVIFVDKLTSL
jgi:hypothetical protein